MFGRQPAIGLLAFAGALALGALPAVAQLQDETDTANQSSSEITGGQTDALVTFSTVTLISQQIGGFLPQDGPVGEMALGSISDYGSGLSAGGVDGKLSLWANGSYSDVENDHAPTAYDGDVVTGFVGADFRVSDEWILGLSLGYDSSDIDTTANSGNSETDGYTVAPYVAYVITPNHSIDAMAGYAWSSTDQTRLAAGATVTGDSDSERMFGSVNYNISYWKGLWNLGGKVGYVWSRTERDAFTESNGTANAESVNALGQLRVGAKVAYWLDGYMPFASVTYEEDLVFSRLAVGAGQVQPDNDPNGINIQAGLNIFGDGAWSGGLLGSTTALRSQVDNITVSGNIRYAF